MAKGNLVVGQGGGPTAVINSSLVGVIHEAMANDIYASLGERGPIGDIYGMVHGVEGFLQGDIIDLRKQSRSALETLRYTPASALGTARYKPSKEEFVKVVEKLKAMKIRYFFYIGGNDSASIVRGVNRAAKELDYNVYAIAVPKTVDNDLVGTDHCPGYGSGARFVAAAIRNTGRDTEAMGKYGPIRLMEIMGRNAGWLTAATALAREEERDAPHLVYVPERPVTVEQVVEDVRRVYEKLGFCVAAISEGTVDPSGRSIGEDIAPKEVDGFGHVRKGGVTPFLSELINAKLGIRARLDNPYYLQRSFVEMASLVDQDEAYRVGRQAVRAALAGAKGVMITLEREAGPEYYCSTGVVDVEKVADQESKMPADMMNEAGNFPTQKFLNYARPLIGGPLPKLARLEMIRV